MIEIKNWILISVTVVIVLVVAYLFKKQEDQEKKIEELLEKNNQLMAENISLETNRLKLILQPHTLNNILAQLKVFSNKLHRGMESLSANLEYIFYKGEHHFVSLSDEIGFVKSYLSLNELFIRNLDSITIDDTQIDEDSEYYNKDCIPHLITAYFLENAFKHGNTEHSEFLNVFLSLDGNRFEIKVVNQIKAKLHNHKSGIGLKNMKSRLDLLMEGKFEILQSCTENEYSSTLIINL